ncbi:MAG: ribose 5-phosphate isomerase B [Candidatus Latescibacteria bacterium]|nr:ribose 5-phosphate isomerase B [Candidatus Latescibacterota bacterium]
MRVAIGADHAGFELKEKIKGYFDSIGQFYKDFGACQFDPQDDYPDYGFKVAEAVAAGEFDRGILVCGTGIGMSVVANKVRGVIAALCTTPFMARISRTHNNANVLVLGGRTTPADQALQIVKLWTETEFEGGRHQRRCSKILKYESHGCKEKKGDNS